MRLQDTVCGTLPSGMGDHDLQAGLQELREAGPGRLRCTLGSVVMG
ncbi:MAG: hypothetical protein R2716_12900 [Microthrixaceae bacterium]